MKKSIVVFGANGFIGSNLARYVVDNNLLDEYEFLFVGNKTIHYKIEGLNYELLDLTNSFALTDFLLKIKPNYIINLAGVIDNVSLDNCLSINAELPRKIFEIVLLHDLVIDNILLVGSAAEYGENKNFPISESEKLHPLSYYGLSKTIQTEYFKFYSQRLNINVVRTFNVIGPFISNKLAIGAFIDKINKCNDKGIIHTGSLSSKRDYLDVNDVIAAFLSVLFKGKSGEVYNVCSGKGISMSDILNSLIKASGKSIQVVVDDKLFKQVNVPVSYGDNTKLKKHTGWEAKIDIENSCKNLF
ncbi:NAD-dependent epimerase/dehydratase family protein [Flavobacterium limi]|uniref:GDP-mannose 4,6-dehydratase n=1 Tax=Flavobacterium limi TaxID=2045105 RepID=A0ABQ1U4D3_9FLAO|nr:NAD-dependent epimerase/dehydratase family protein [Flavobacterium limi]GGF08133.1 GDP-mannose 4,6-dehydratase [Flavobacterium limi]